MIIMSKKTKVRINIARRLDELYYDCKANPYDNGVHAHYFGMCEALAMAGIRCRREEYANPATGYTAIIHHLRG